MGTNAPLKRTTVEPKRRGNPYIATPAAPAPPVQAPAPALVPA